MSITLQQAQQAGQIADQIAKVQGLLTVAQQAQAGGWCISKLAVVSPSGQEYPLLIDVLDQTNSATALASAISVYQGMLTQLNAELASF